MWGCRRELEKEELESLMVPTTTISTNYGEEEEKAKEENVNDPRGDGWLTHMSILGPSTKKGPGFKPSGVQVKLLLALCQMSLTWGWELAMACQVVSAGAAAIVIQNKTKCHYRQKGSKEKGGSNEIEHSYLLIKSF